MASGSSNYKILHVPYEKNGMIFVRSSPPFRRYLLQFPPYATNETGRPGAGRREMGHGRCILISDWFTHLLSHKIFSNQITSYQISPHLTKYFSDQNIFSPKYRPTMYLLPHVDTKYRYFSRRPSGEGVTSRDT